jgi:hypothetical protein
VWYLVFVGWLENSPAQLAGAAGFVIGLLAALLFSGIGLALAFNQALAASSTALNRIAACVSLTLNIIPWVYVLIAALFRP